MRNEYRYRDKHSFSRDLYPGSTALFFRAVGGTLSDIYDNGKYKRAEAVSRDLPVSVCWNGRFLSKNVYTEYKEIIANEFSFV